MSKVLVGSTLEYKVSSPTSFLLHFAVVQNEFQVVLREETSVSDGLQLEYCQVGSSGNRLYRLDVNAGQFTLNYQAEIELTQGVFDPAELKESRYKDLPPDTLTYLNPSRYCESDKLYRYAAEEFGAIEPGFQRVCAIQDWVFNNLSYTIGSTGPTTTACDVLLQREGVCRDFAHLAISFCRAMGIPARYVSGYAVALEPPDFHGFFEAFLDGHWVMFDATRLAPVSGFVRIGTGRDAADVAFATLIGEAELVQKSVWANLPPSDVMESGDISQTQGLSTSN